MDQYVLKMCNLGNIYLITILRRTKYDGKLIDFCKVATNWIGEKKSVLVRELQRK